MGDAACGGNGGGLKGALDFIFFHIEAVEGAEEEVFVVPEEFFDALGKELEDGFFVQDGVVFGEPFFGREEWVIRIHEREDRENMGTTGI